MHISYLDQLGAFIERHQACCQLFNQRAGYARMMDEPHAWMLFPTWSDDKCQEIMADHDLLKSRILVNLYETTRGLIQVNSDEDQEAELRELEIQFREKSFAAIAAAEALGHDTGVVLPRFSHTRITEGNFMPLLLAQIDENIDMSESCLEFMTAVTVMAIRHGERTPAQNSMMAMAQAEYRFHYETAASQMTQVDQMLALGLTYPAP